MKKYLSPITYLIATIIVAALYYSFVFKTLERAIKSQAEHEFVSDMQMKAMYFDNAVSKYIQGTKSVGSRSTIKKKIIEFKNGNISFSELKTFTDPIYNDGIKALEDVIGAKRYVNSQLVVQIGEYTAADAESLVKDPINQLKTGFLLKDSISFTHVISPITNNTDILGYDIIYYDNKPIEQEISDSTIEFSLQYNAQDTDTVYSNDEIIYTSDKATCVIKSEHANAYFRFTTAKDLVLKDLNNFYKNQLLEIVLILICTIFLIYIIHWRAKLISIKKSEEKFRNMIKDMHVGVLLHGPQAEMLMSNPKALEMLGLTEDQLLGKASYDPNWNVVHKDGSDFPKNTHPVSVAIATSEAVFDVIMGVYNPQKKERVWLLVSAIPQIKKGVVQQVLCTCVDITKEINAEALKESESKFRNLFELANDAIFIADAETGIMVDANLKACNLIGRNLEEIIGMHQSELHPKSQSEETINSFKDDLNRQEQNVYKEFYVEHKNGQLIPVEISPSIIEINGKSNILGIFRDISERKKAEEALKESEEKIRYILKHNPNAIAVFDNNMDILLASDRFKKDYQVEQQNIIGRNNYEVFPEIPERWRKIHQRALKGEVLQNEDDYFIRPDGSTTYSRWECRPWYHSDGSIGGMIAYTEVTTERKLAEIALKESEEKYRLITENATDVIWILNLTQQKFTYVSPSVFTLRGYTPEEVMKHGISESLTPESAKIVTDGISESMIEFLKSPTDYSKVIHLNELQQPCKNGEIIWIETTTRYQFNSNNEVEVIGISRNIDDRKKAVLELVDAKEKAEESEILLRDLNATKDKLFSIIGHDLRSPFNSIIGLSDLLKLTFSTENQDIKEAESIAKMIHASAKSTLVLLDNLLTWAKAQRGQINFDPVTLKLESIIVEVFDILNPTAEIKNISLNYNQSIETEVYADENMLRTILRNLVSNGIKFTNTNGKIEIYTSHKQSFIEITVSDNGVGMNEESIGKLFKIDKSVTTRGTANEKGSGLGLLLCKEFVDMHGGRIWVESAVGKGSAFKFTLPDR